jgi:hypothetical protein
MGIVAKNIVKKEKAEEKQPIVINNFAEWRANLTKPQEEAKIEKPVVEDTISYNKRQPSSKWLSIKNSDYVSHLIK